MGLGGEPIWNISGDPLKPKATICRVAILTGASGERLLVPLDVQALAQDWPNIVDHLAKLETPVSTAGVVVWTTADIVAVFRSPSDFEYGEIARSLIAWYQVLQHAGDALQAPTWVTDAGAYSPRKD